ncbi:MAG: hypothetical protein RLZZ133_1521 [Pseudomonadota bacterium]|jgi:hypothetical protein
MPHRAAVLFLLLLGIGLTAAWLIVQGSRAEPLPSLVWAPELPAEKILGLPLAVLDRKPGGWWWIEADPEQRHRLRREGAWLAIALPTPVARMAGCSSDTPLNPEAVGLRP